MAGNCLDRPAAAGKLREAVDALDTIGMSFNAIGDSVHTLNEGFKGGSSASPVSLVYQGVYDLLSENFSSLTNISSLNAQLLDLINRGTGQTGDRQSIECELTKTYTNQNVVSNTQQSGIKDFGETANQVVEVTTQVQNLYDSYNNLIGAYQGLFSIAAATGFTELEDKCSEAADAVRDIASNTTDQFKEFTKNFEQAVENAKTAVGMSASEVGEGINKMKSSFDSLDYGVLSRTGEMTV